MFLTNRFNLSSLVFRRKRFSKSSDDSHSRSAMILYKYILSWIARDKLPDRTNRIEPRAVKRRPKEYALLNKTGSEMREALLQ